MCASCTHGFSHGAQIVKFLEGAGDYAVLDHDEYERLLPCHPPSTTACLLTRPLELLRRDHRRCHENGEPNDPKFNRLHTRVGKAPIPQTPFRTLP